jgi:hypothetical protein
MSFILLGPKRVYVVLLCCQKLADPCCALCRSLAEIDQAFGTEELAYGEDGRAAGGRLVTAVRCYRIFWERLITPASRRHDDLGLHIGIAPEKHQPDAHEACGLASCSVRKRSYTDTSNAEASLCKVSNVGLTCPDSRRW